jgi:hypothetical protein
MKLTGPACTEALNEAEKAERRERAEDNAGGVRVELRVRPRGRLIRNSIWIASICAKNSKPDPPTLLLCRNLIWVNRLRQCSEPYSALS